MAALQVLGFFTPCRSTAHWCTHVYRHWNGESDSRAKHAICQAKDYIWEHDTCSQQMASGKILCSFDGAFRPSTGQGGAAWHVWKLDTSSGIRSLLACGHHYMQNSGSVEAELQALAELTNFIGRVALPSVRD
eukprot:8786206-Karenia_brevis.AAC.1